MFLYDAGFLEKKPNALDITRKNWSSTSRNLILEELEVQPENSIIATAKPIPAISTFQSLPGVTLADNAGFDALFEEMVTSIPINREQPLFAQNLGFYTGNLDKDFLEALQQPSDG
ncbi:hypothetical protein ACN38_g10515 [Penicillium nordicum]|uniref:Uncharacterized protein n=1 Tax=Penicillium nordicum TaxID=229535 RepID=A0A0M8P1R6_9EURO|nr:hypothetical protein ACN38_g10515 [Penicillium nordicum]